MADREKLIELIQSAVGGCARYWAELIADILIANGFRLETKQATSDKASEWISVEDRLPGTQKILITDGDVVMRGYRRPDGTWKYGVGAHETWDRLSLRPVTHWMPLPKPPQEEI